VILAVLDVIDVENQSYSKEELLTLIKLAISIDLNFEEEVSYIY